MKPTARPVAQAGANRVPEPVARYLQHLAAERRLSAHTVAAYRSDLETLLRLTAGRALDTLGSSDVRDAVVQLRGRGLGATSVARHLSSWRGFFAYACRRLGFTANPCVGLRPPKAPKRLPEPLSVDACAQLLDAPDADGDAVLRARDRAMFELLYSSGLRLAELTGLDLADVDLAGGEALVTGKGRKTRIVPIGRHALAALAAWLPVRAALAPDGPALFVSRRGSRLGPRSVELRLAHWARRAGLARHVHPHLLRHAFATHVLQSSGDLRAVQDMLGHASISTTQVYTHLDWQHLARIYDQAHPRARRKDGELP